MTPDVDFAILGAGCAGLSLAAALAVEQVPGRVLLLEPRTEYKRDRTWCFWNTEDHPFASAVSCSWNSWRVSCGAAATVRSSRNYRYCHLAGDDFYRSALAGVDRAPEQELLRGVTVRSVTRREDGLFAVDTDSGLLLAGKVFDSRPPAPYAANNFESAPALLQRFVGWHVRTTDPCFDSRTVELMGFLPSGLPGRARFMYVLPFSETEALVEMTYLDRPELPEPAYKNDLEDWLGERTSQWKVLYAEKGSLPMGGRPVLTGTRRSRVEPGLHAIGIRGGRIKPSSGYAFLRIQRHSRAIAQSLKQGTVPPAHAEPGLAGALDRGMDAVFLQAIGRAPEEAPALFLRMFARSEPDALVRFLSEASRGPAEKLRVAWSLPKRTMMQAALRTGLQAMQPVPAGRPRKLASKTVFRVASPQRARFAVPELAANGLHQQQSILKTTGQPDRREVAL